MTRFSAFSAGSRGAAKVLQKKFVKPDNDNTKAIALSLAALAAAGAAFVIGKNSAKTKEIVKEFENNISQEINFEDLLVNDDYDFWDEEE